LIAVFIIAAAFAGYIVGWWRGWGAGRAGEPGLD
jgi:hypothetical protein